MKHHCLCFILAISAGAPSVSPCLAQQQRRPQQQQQNPEELRRIRQQESLKIRQEYKANELREQVELPALPRYTGRQQFVSGEIYPNIKGGPSYIMHFAAQEPAVTVRDWYLAALPAQGWKIFKSNQTGVYANHPEGHNCYVTFLDRATKNEKCRYSINFHTKK